MCVETYYNSAEDLGRSLDQKYPQTVCLENEIRHVRVQVHAESLFLWQATQQLRPGYYASGLIMR